MSTSVLPKAKRVSFSSLFFKPDISERFHSREKYSSYEFPGFFFSYIPGKRSKSYEDDPDWTPSTWYRTLHKKPKCDPKQPVVRKTIDMIRYDRARAEAKRKEEERRRNSRKIRSESAPD